MTRAGSLLRRLSVHDAPQGIWQSERDRQTDDDEASRVEQVVIASLALHYSDNRLTAWLTSWLPARLLGREIYCRSYRIYKSDLQALAATQI